MVPIEKMRELIPDSEKYTDAELVKIREQLEALANIAFDMWLKERNKVEK
jgi:hypothetical protein